MVGRPVGRFQADYNATVWPQLIIWDGDQMILDVQLGRSVAIIKLIKFVGIILILVINFQHDEFQPS